MDNKTIKPALDELKNELIKLYGISLKNIILFGSYARGDYDTESDIDIMILLDLNDREQSKYRSILVEKTTDISIKHDVLISVLDNNYDDFNKRTSYVPFYKNVIQEGIKLYVS